MKTLNISLVAVGVLVGALIGAYLFINNTAFGSVEIGHEYTARQIKSTNTGTSSLKTTFGGIGSVVVASSSGANRSISFYDTAGNSTTTSATTTLIMTLDTTINEGSYQFDVQFTRGLLIDVTPGFNGDVIMTYR